MDKCMLIGCDCHEKTLVLEVAVDRECSVGRDYPNTPGCREAMIRELKRQAKEASCSRILFAYETSGQGFGLHDQLRGAGIECFVLASGKIPRSPKQRKRKTDRTDAKLLLDVLRGHVLAGIALPAIHVPSAQVRDDREMVRARVETAAKASGVKTQIGSLLKRYEVRRPKESGRGWTASYRRWLKALAECDEPLGSGARAALASLLRQLVSLEEEVGRLDEEVRHLAQRPRYSPVVEALGRHKGVGTIVAMVFLTEMGRPDRFGNRRQVGAMWGLAPSCLESGDGGERKGHITRQGSPWMRKALCQAVWARVRTDPAEKLAYERIAARNPRHKKIAVVASMRRLAVRLWHTAMEVWEQQPADSPVRDIA